MHRMGTATRRYSKQCLAAGGRALIQLCARRGADPRVKNKHGVSPVKLARTIANYDVRQFFTDLPEATDG